MLNQEEDMGSIHKASGTHGKAGQWRMLQSMYEAARKEVFADPAAALRKYQPSWQFSLPPTPRKAGRHR